LKTARLVLRRATIGDLDDLFAVFRNPQAMRYWSTPPHADRATTQERVQAMAAQEPLTYFVITCDGRAIGTAGMHRPYEVGFLLHPDYWRRGIATEAMQAIIPHLFAVTDAPSLTADVDPRNLASCGLLERLGFRETHRAQATFCVNDEWSDSIYLALPRPNR
jgi:ribosomal-protein-alanine N-acetyltransferase